MAETVILMECPDTDWSYLALKGNGCNPCIIFKKAKKYVRVLRRIWICLNMPGQQLWYQDWKKQIKDANQVIIFASALNLSMPKYINRLNPNARVIMWYWNCIVKKTLPEKIKGKCEIWSFDPQNCRQYGLNYNHQFYFKSLVMPQVETEYDVYFCGSDSGRGEIITDLYEQCVKIGLRVKCQIVYPRYEHIPDEIKAKAVPYEEIRNNIAKSKAILEIVRTEQSGGTIRTMEAVFFQKKLITNNPAVKEEVFYDENNIFLLGERSISELKAFLETPMRKYENALMDQYDVWRWIRNF